MLRLAVEKDAAPCDITSVELTDDGELYSFDAALKKYQLSEPALDRASCLDPTRQSTGLYAISLGLSQRYSDDHEMLSRGLIMYNALYSWCKECQGESHN